MIEDEPPEWPLAEHMRQGRLAVAAIAVQTGYDAPQPLCHHFSELSPLDPMTDAVAEAYARPEPLFAAHGLEFLSDGLEAWEECRPTLDWLGARIPALVGIASAHGLRYEGWTWEPRDRQPIGACTFPVINNMSAANDQS